MGRGASAAVRSPPFFQRSGCGIAVHTPGAGFALTRATRLRIGPADILAHLRGLEIEICHPIKRQTARGNVAGVLGRVIVDFHLDLLYAQNINRKCIRW